ncbi:hypothetical protein [Sulfuriflexus sp.]|uniref:hypothetical protein n=1 Tax=Sulfuriflexus sp. TaxID=2015443 RepID=UPI0028CBFAF7|nr:hypothetical protein [Sulfuriflexus sp.]MDT8404728.1 hypothetical protein [Sulfuriflexus sp.]
MKHIFLGREMAQQRDFSEHTAEIIDAEICRLVRSVEEQVMELVKKHRRSLDALAQKLLEKETLSGDEIQSIITNNQQAAEQA